MSMLACLRSRARAGRSSSASGTTSPARAGRSPGREDLKRRDGNHGMRDKFKKLKRLNCRSRAFRRATGGEVRDAFERCRGDGRLTEARFAAALAEGSRTEHLGGLCF